MLDPAFRRFFAAHSVNVAGSALSAGALPLLAVLVLDATPWQVSLLAASGLAATAIVALGLGAAIDRGSKRTFMIASSLVAATAMASIPAAVALGWLTFGQLCLVSVVQAITGVTYLAASGAYVKSVVPQQHLVSAASRVDTVGWTTQTAGPPAGGLLISAFGPAVTVLADAGSYLMSALMLLRCPPTPPAPPHPQDRGMLTGWRWIAGHPALRLLYLNAMVFGGAVMWTSPLMAVRLLQDLHATPWQYGLTLGVPCLGGLAGALLSPRLAAQAGQHRLLVLSGIGRAPWLLALPFLDNVWAVTVCETMLLLGAGLFNPLFAAYRMTATPDHLMGRVVAAWAMGSKTVQPAFMLLGGIAATVWSTRTSLLLAGIMCLASIACLPRTQRLSDTAEPAMAQ